jgi:hypothetical protein
MIPKRSETNQLSPMIAPALFLEDLPEHSASRRNLSTVHGFYYVDKTEPFKVPMRRSYTE